jgi:hypothetical protein
MLAINQIADSCTRGWPFGPARSVLCGLIVASALLGCNEVSNEQELSPYPDPINWQSRLSVATGDALIGPWRMNDSDFHYVDDPAVAIAANGDALIAWVDNQAQTIFLQRFGSDDSGLLSEPSPASRSPEIFSWLPRVATLDGGDTVLVAWEEILFTGGSHGGEILVVRSADGGRSFGEPINLSQTTGGAGKGRLSPDRWDNGSLDLLAHDEHVWVAWTEYEGELRLARSTDGGQSFSSAQHLSGGAEQPTRAPALAILPDGRILLAWTYGEADNADVQLAVSENQGDSFELLGAVIQREGHADAPRLATDDEGRAHLVFAESPAGPGGPARLVYARSDQDLRFDQPQVLMDLPEPDEAYVGYPQIIIEGADLIINWEILDPRSALSLGLGLLHSPDYGDRFGPPHLVPGSEAPDGGIGGGLQGRLMRKTALGSDGQVLIGHSHFVPDQGSEILLLRGQLARY